MNLRKRYDQDFKLNTIQLIMGGNTSLAAVSRDLGVSKSTLHDWLKEYRTNKDKAFTKSESSSSQNEDIRRLRRENEILRQERDILKNHPNGTPFPNK